jgi:hypothetical protein
VASGRDRRYDGEMDEALSDMVAEWRRMASDNRRLLADIEAGMTRRTYSAAEVAKIKSEAEQFTVLADQAEAEND